MCLPDDILDLKTADWYEWYAPIPLMATSNVHWKVLVAQRQYKCDTELGPYKTVSYLIF